MFPDLKTIVKDNFVRFLYFRENVFYYIADVYNEEGARYDCYQFPVPLEDVTGVTLKNDDKAIFFMRWIRKALDEKTFIKYDS